MANDIKKLADWYVRKLGTRNPFSIASSLNILVKTENLGSYSGCYIYLNRHRCIFLNRDLAEEERQLVMAHELGHAILHKRQNCYFIRNKILLLCSKIEREANLFAVNLLIDDEDLEQYRGFTTNQLSSVYGMDRRLIEMK